MPVVHGPEAVGNSRTSQGRPSSRNWPSPSNRRRSWPPGDHTVIRLAKGSTTWTRRPSRLTRTRPTRSNPPSTSRVRRTDDLESGSVAQLWLAPNGAVAEIRTVAVVRTSQQPASGLARSLAPFPVRARALERHIGRSPRFRPPHQSATGHIGDSERVAAHAPHRVGVASRARKPVGSSTLRSSDSVSPRPIVYQTTRLSTSSKVCIHRSPVDIPRR